MYLERFRLDGRTALVTGGASGIGLCCVDALAEAGATVVIADRDAPAIEAAVQAMTARGHAVDGALLDVTDAAAVEAAADRMMAAHGRIDVLVNNAGIARSEIAAEDMEVERWLNVLDV